MLRDHRPSTRWWRSIRDGGAARERSRRRGRRRRVRARAGGCAVAAFDVALDLQGLLKSGVLAAVTRAPLRIGFAAGAVREPLNRCSTTAASTAGLRASRRRSSPVVARTAPRDRARPGVPAARRAGGGARADEFLARGRQAGSPLVVLNPGAGRPDSAGPRSATRARERLTEDAGADVVVVWAGGGDGGRSVAPAAPRARCSVPLRTSTSWSRSAARRTSWSRPTRDRSTWRRPGHRAWDCTDRPRPCATDRTAPATIACRVPAAG